jgi:hypothetical protein
MENLKKEKKENILERILVKISKKNSESQLLMLQREEKL